jgi:hypothetical protein
MLLSPFVGNVQQHVMNLVLDDDGLVMMCSVIDVSYDTLSRYVYLFEFVIIKFLIWKFPLELDTDRRFSGSSHLGLEFAAEYDMVSGYVLGCAYMSDGITR